MSKDSAPTLLSLPGSAAYFQRLQTAFGEAAGHGAEEHFFRIGGHDVQVRCAGGRMAACLQAFEHLRVDPAVPSLVMCLADAAGTGCAPPGMPAWSGEAFQCGDSWHLAEEGNEVWCHRTESGIAALHMNASTGIYWVDDVWRMPQHEFGSPLLRLLHWWFSRRDRQVLHAAAVGFPEGGVLLTGRAGAGKSTSAVACLASSLQYAGDDYCLVSSSGPPRAFSLYNSAKVHWDNPIRSGIEGVPSAYETEEKALYFIQQVSLQRMLREFPVRAILVPVATGGRDTALRPIGAGEAFLAAAPSTAMQLPGLERQTYGNMGALFRQVPCYTLEAGTDLQQIPQVIIDLLQRH